MTDDESSKPRESTAPAKRARRSRRGGRGRGRKIAPSSVHSAAEPKAPIEALESAVSSEPEFQPAAAEAPMADSPIEEARREAAEASVAEQAEEREERPERSSWARPERRDFKPAAPAAVADAIEEVTHVITSLKQVLDEMEEILETLELAEIQKTADEREIQSLRSALRQLERRGGESRAEQHSSHGHPPQRHERRGRR